MTHKFLKLAGVKTEEEFYKKYPTEKAFFKTHPSAHPSYAKGGTVPSKDINTGEFLNTRLGLSSDNVITPLPTESSTGGCTDAKGNPIPCPPGVKAGTVIVTNPNDPRLKAYKKELQANADSARLFNTTVKSMPIQLAELKAQGFNPVGKPNNYSLSETNGSDELNPNTINPNIKPISRNTGYMDKNGREILGSYVNVFKRPQDPNNIQPVVYQKPQQAPTERYSGTPLAGWTPLTPEIAKGNYAGSLKDMYYKPTGDPKHPYNITAFTPPVPQERKDYPIRGPLPKAQAKINITSPQPYTDPVPQGDYIYGPANSVIGINSKNGFVPWEDDFDPTSNKSQRGKVNKADSDLLQNPEELKKYLKTKGLKNGGKLKAAWGAELGTNQFEGGPMPINPYPQGFKIPKLDAMGNPISDPVPNIGGATPWIAKGQPNPLAPVPSSITPVPYAPSYKPAQTQEWHGPQVEGSQEFENGLPDNHPDKKQTSQPAGRTPKAPVKKEKKSLSMPEGAGGGGMTGQGILAGLEMYDAFMGPDRIKRRYVRPEDMQSYNPNQYGTGSSAISEYGNTLKPKKAFWGALIGAAGGAGIKPVQGLHNNINEGMAPLLNISNQATARAQQLDTMDFQNTANLQSPQQLLPQQKPYGYMENGGEMRYNNGGNVQTYYEEGKDYDVDEKELQRLLKAGYAVKY